METIQEQGSDTGEKPPKTGFGSTTTAAEVISGVSLEGKVAITGRRSKRVYRHNRGKRPCQPPANHRDLPITETSDSQERETL